jgi:glycerophosphoryl diester phosphodiesterase
VRASPRIYAHRLGAAYGADSSATALERTLAGPIDGLETDVCLCADGGLALLHDPLLSIGTTLTGWAHERSSTEIASARLHGRNGTAGSERPLLLDDLLGRVPAHLTLQLEVKAHADADLARRTARAICARCADHRDRVEVISFHTAACEAAAAEGFRSRLVVFADYEPEALAAWAVTRGVLGISVEHFLLTERMMRPMRLAGLSVSTGTVNEPELLERVLTLSPDSICTDRPHEIAAWAQLAGSHPFSGCPTPGTESSLTAIAERTATPFPKPVR